jgi:dTDP-4-dehydrorhamnose 3,5-epimerase
MFEETPIDGVLVVRPKRHGDGRGFFCETWSRDAFTAQGLEFAWCQDNHSLSRAPGVLRGLHYQAPPRAQAKLVRCSRGRIWDVAVDVRRGSVSYGRWFGLELSAENGAQLLIPQGFLHGFVTLEPDSEVQYKVDNPYAPECDGAIIWDDPEIAIDWPLAGDPELSGKDKVAPRMADWNSPFCIGDQS